ncbi:FecR domain-containing protein [Novosphingobium sp.]|uniref:FecR family protein n=1 Tax=Novosphingobium sp. TaxID=1874826 RepID=UPI0025DAD64D|nr:FecR domain-containing protein [Novosphingobium sp.]
MLATTPALAEIGRIKSNVGTAQIVRGKQTIAAAPGFKLEATDQLVTGKDGRMGIAFTDDTRIAVGPNSKIVLATYKYDRTQQTGQFVARVNKGSLGVVSGKIAKSAKDAMQVHTPTTILGVRGTRFVVDVK